MSLHNEIMNIPSNPPDAECDVHFAYRVGHRDARHAAAELSLKYERLIEEMREDIINTILSIESNPNIDELTEEMLEKYKCSQKDN